MNPSLLQGRRSPIIPQAGASCDVPPGAAKKPPWGQSYIVTFAIGSLVPTSITDIDGNAVGDSTSQLQVTAEIDTHIEDMIVDYAAGLSTVDNYMLANAEYCTKKLVKDADVDIFRKSTGANLVRPAFKLNIRDTKTLYLDFALNLAEAAAVVLVVTFAGSQAEGCCDGPNCKFDQVTNLPYFESVAVPIAATNLTGSASFKPPINTRVDQLITRLSTDLTAGGVCMVSADYCRKSLLDNQDIQSFQMLNGPRFSMGVKAEKKLTFTNTLNTAEAVNDTTILNTICGVQAEGCC